MHLLNVDRKSSILLILSILIIFIQFSTSLTIKNSFCLFQTVYQNNSIECKISFSYIEGGIAKCSLLRSNSVIFHSSIAIVNLTFVCSSNASIYADVDFEFGIPYKEYLQMYWQRNISLKHSHELVVFPPIITNKPLSVIRYIFSGSPTRSDESIFVLWYASNRDVGENISPVGLWMGHGNPNTYPYQVNDPGLEIIHIPCIAALPGLRISQSPFESDIPVDNDTLSYDPMNGFFLDTTKYESHEGVYRCKGGFNYFTFEIKKSTTGNIPSISRTHDWDFISNVSNTFWDILLVNYNERQRVVQCTSEWGYDNTFAELRQIECENVFSCNLLTKCLQKSNSVAQYCMNGLAFGSVCPNNYAYHPGYNSSDEDEIPEIPQMACKSINPVTKGVLQCVGRGESLIKSFFYGFDGKFYMNEFSPPLDAILQTALVGEANTTLPSQNHYQFHCKAHSFFFEKGLMWFYKYSNGTTKRVDRDEIIILDPSNADSYDLYNPVSLVNIYLEDSSISSIICSAPVLSINNMSTSYMWTNISVDISLQNPIPPTMSLENILVKKIKLGDTGQSLKCQAFGFPEPDLKWFHNDNEIIGDKVVDNMIYKLLQFPVYNEEDAGMYTCKASNQAGVAESVFAVQTDFDIKNHNIWNGWPIGVIIGTFVILIATFTVIILVYRKSVKHTRDRELQEILSILNGDKNCTTLTLDNENSDEQEPQMCPLRVKELVKLPYKKSYEIPKNDFEIDWEKLLGSGQSAEVYKGRIIGIENHVAFKTMRCKEAVINLKSLVSELKILIYIGKHENIINFHGAYTQEIKNGNLYVALEYCALGSLESYLQSNQGRFLSCQFLQANSEPKAIEIARPNSGYVTTAFLGKSSHTIATLHKWCKEIANAMDFLGTKRVVHADLATRNVLLTVDFSAKLSDFGLSRRTYNTTEYWKNTEEPIPWRWLAPESLEKKVYTTKSDVWAYGITLWEIFSLGECPYQGMPPTPEFLSLLKIGLKNPKPKYASMEMYNVMTKCWSLDPVKRPTFSNFKLLFQNAIDTPEYLVDIEILTE